MAPAILGPAEGVLMELATPSLACLRTIASLSLALA